MSFVPSFFCHLFRHCHRTFHFFCHFSVIRLVGFISSFVFGDAFHTFIWCLLWGRQFLFIRSLIPCVFAVAAIFRVSWYMCVCACACAASCHGLGRTGVCRQPRTTDRCPARVLESLSHWREGVGTISTRKSKAFGIRAFSCYLNLHVCQVRRQSSCSLASLCVRHCEAAGPTRPVAVAAQQV